MQRVEAENTEKGFRLDPLEQFRQEIFYLIVLRMSRKNDQVCYSVVINNWLKINIHTYIFIIALQIY